MRRLDRAAARLLYLTPRDVDKLSFLELYDALAGARERERDEWRRTLIGATAVLNWGGMRGKGFKEKPLSYLYDRLMETPISLAGLRAKFAAGRAYGKERFERNQRIKNGRQPG